MKNLNAVRTPNGCADSCGSACASGVPRRYFLGQMGASTLALASSAPRAAARGAEPDRQAPIRKPLRVQPVLCYDAPNRRAGTSWRNWGGISTEQEAAAEKERIGRELAAMAKEAGFPLEILPIAGSRTPEQSAAIGRGDHDLALIYAAGGLWNVLDPLAPRDKWTVMFVRHRSGPVYLWYEIAHAAFLRKMVDRWEPHLSIDDVVVDEHPEVLLRLRALYGLKNTLSKRIVVIGAPNGWGIEGRVAPDRARELWKLDLHIVSYQELGERIKKAREDDAVVKRARLASEKYLSDKNAALQTSRDFVDRAFILTEVFRDLLDEARTDAITINDCMAMVMRVANTSACLTLSILNDEGYLAFCESDFVVIPAGILLRHISQKPVFLNDPTYPHHGIVTIAHCTAPRKLDGRHAEPVKVLTHFESDYGAAPKVEFRKGMVTTNLIPDFSSRKWVGVLGDVLGSPFLPICRSQADLAIKGDTRRLLEEMRGFHWITSYGDYLGEIAYALGKVGVGFANVSRGA